jgi:hypothetical protein
MIGINKGQLNKIMLTMCHDNHMLMACGSWILGKRFYEEMQVGMPYLDVVRKYLLVLKR